MNFECNLKNQDLNIKWLSYFAIRWSLTQLSIENDKNEVLECVYINMFTTKVIFKYWLEWLSGDRVTKFNFDLESSVLSSECSADA